MTGGASAPRSTSRSDPANGDQIVLLDGVTNFGFGDVQTMAQRSFVTRVPIIGVNWLKQVHFRIPTNPDSQDIETQSHFVSSFYRRSN
jgi:hypothetical protein